MQSPTVTAPRRCAYSGASDSTLLLARKGHPHPDHRLSASRDASGPSRRSSRDRRAVLPRSPGRAGRTALRPGTPCAGRGHRERTANACQLHSRCVHAPTMPTTVMLMTAQPVRAGRRSRLLLTSAVASLLLVLSPATAHAAPDGHPITSSAGAEGAVARGGAPRAPRPLWPATTALPAAAVRKVTSPPAFSSENSLLLVRR